MEQRAGVEDRLRRVAGQVPEQVLRREQMGKRRIHEAAVGIDGEVRQHVGSGDADLRARGMKLLLGGANVRPLLDQLRRHAHRQIDRQVQVGEPERFPRSALG